MKLIRTESITDVCICGRPALEHGLGGHPKNGCDVSIEFLLSGEPDPERCTTCGASIAHVVGPSIVAALCPVCDVYAFDEYIDDVPDPYWQKVDDERRLEGVR
jgi:hypothetical protein